MMTAAMRRPGARLAALCAALLALAAAMLLAAGPAAGAESQLQRSSQRRLLRADALSVGAQAVLNACLKDRRNTRAKCTSLGASTQACMAAYGPGCLRCSTKKPKQCTAVTNAASFSLVKGKAVAKAGYEPHPPTAIGARRCEPGSSKATVSNTKCTKCAAGKYQPSSGQKACLTCPAPRKVAAGGTKCSVPGVPKPCTCEPQIASPVCGADGNTYPNACKAACAGTTVASQGSCRIVAPPVPSGSCLCHPDPLEPEVCGANGKTYRSACIAKCSKIAIADATAPCPCTLGCGECTGSGPRDCIACWSLNTYLKDGACEMCPGTASSTSTRTTDEATSCTPNKVVGCKISRDGDPDSCNECHDGWLIQGTTCVACNPKCAACSGDASNCTSCGPGYFDPTPSDASSTLCTECNTSCGTCLGNATTCVGCKTGFKWSDSDKTCTTCPSKTTTTSPTDSTCTACALGCPSCPGNPNVCTAPASFAKKCANGFARATDGSLSSDCAGCKDKACRSCSNDVNVCTRCADFHYLSNGTCKACNAPCLLCSGGPNTCVNVNFFIDVGKPFTDPLDFKFNVKVRPDNVVKLSASAASGIDLFGEGILRFIVAAEMTIKAGVDTVIRATGATTAALKLKSLPWLTINSMAVDATFKPALPEPLTGLGFAGNVTVATVRAAMVMTCDLTEEDKCAMLYSIERFDLAAVLKAVGVKGNLGPFTLVIHQAKVSHAQREMTLGNITIPMGTFVAGNLTLFNILEAKVLVEVRDKGAFFDVTYSNKQLTKLQGQAQARVKKVLDNVPNTISKAKKDTNKALDVAANQIKIAVANADAAQRALDAVKEPVEKELKKAAENLENISITFGKAQKGANDELIRAQTKVNDAERAFATAINDANRLVESGEIAVRRAEDRLKSGREAALAKAEKLRQDIDSASRDASNNKPKCTISLTRVRCTGNLANYLAASARRATLEAARVIAIQAIDIIATSLGKVLVSAQATLKLHRDAAKSVLNGPQSVILKAAREVLNEARQAVDAVLKGTEATVYATARASFETANAAVKSVLDGAEAAAKASADAALEAAKAPVLVLGVPAGELLDMFGGATKELGGLLVESVNLVQLDMLRVKFDSSEEGATMGGALAIALKGKKLPTFDFDIKPSDAVNQMVDAIVEEVKIQLKTITKDLGKFL